MKNKSWVLFCIFCIILFQHTDIQAQKIKKNLSMDPNYPNVRYRVKNSFEKDNKK